MSATGTPLDSAVNSPLSAAVNPSLSAAYKAQTEAERTAETATGEADKQSYAAEDKAHQQFQLDSEESGKSFQALLDRSQAVADDKYKPPTPQDPLKSYGAVVAGLMGLASGFSHGSMIASLNAGAAAINAARQGNTEEYQRKFDEWKTNHDLMKDQLDWEQKAWTVWQDKLQTDHSEASAYATALAARTGNTVMEALNRKGDTASMAQILESSSNLSRNAQEQALNVVTMAYKNEQLLQLRREDSLFAQGLANGTQTVSTTPIVTPEHPVDLSKVTGLTGDISSISKIPGFFDKNFGSDWGEEAQSTDNALKQLRQKTLAAYQTSATTRALSAQIKAVDDIIPYPAGITQYYTLQDNVRRTRDNMLQTMATLKARMGMPGTKTEEYNNVAAYQQFKNTLPDYDAILMANPPTTPVPIRPAVQQAIQQSYGKEPKISEEDRKNNVAPLIVDSDTGHIEAYYDLKKNKWVGL